MGWMEGGKHTEDKKGKELVSELQEPEAKVDPTVPSDMKGLWLQLGGVQGGRVPKQRDKKSRWDNTGEGGRDEDEKCDEEERELSEGGRRGKNKEAIDWRLKEP